MPGACSTSLSISHILEVTVSCPIVDTKSVLQQIALSMVLPDKVSEILPTKNTHLKNKQINMSAIIYIASNSKV